LLTANGSTSLMTATGSSGSFSVTLSSPLLEGEKVRIVQVLPAGSNPLNAERQLCSSELYEVPSTADWGRVHAYFTAGILVSNNSQITQNVSFSSSATGMTVSSIRHQAVGIRNAATTSTTTTDSGNFSQAHQFLDLTLDKAWKLPNCYVMFQHRSEDDGDGKGRLDTCIDSQTGIAAPATFRDHLEPGVGSYFEARLTAIPVSTLNTGSSGSGTPSTVLSTNQLTSAQTARVGVGVYFPFLATRWDYHRQPNALFVAPIAKIGFDTVTGASQQTVILANGTVGTINLENVYNFHAFGMRIGHYQMTRSIKRAPTINSYLDVLFGPYSNLQSYICRRTPATTTTSGGTVTYNPVPGYIPPSNLPNSSCLSDYPDYYSAANNPLPNGADSWGVVNSRKRIYRLDLEGMLKIPATPLYVGFNANLGQKSIGADRLDRGYAAPDDIRFLFGTRFDLGAAINRIGVSPF